MIDVAPGSGRVDPSALEPPETGGVGELDEAVLGGWRPSLRARRAEALAQRVLSDEAAAAPLRDLVRQAAERTRAENAQISIISTRQIAVVVEKGTRRRPGTQSAAPGATSSFEDTICAVSVRADAAIAIPDTRHDNRVASVPAVLDGIVGSYLGTPLRSSDGTVVGVLCVYDTDPHDWTTSDAQALDAVAEHVAAALDALAPVVVPS